MLFAQPLNYLFLNAQPPVEIMAVPSSNYQRLADDPRERKYPTYPQNMVMVIAESAFSERIGEKSCRDWGMHIAPESQRSC